MTRPSDGRLLFLLCLAETLSMTGFAACPGLLPHFQEAWHLSGKAAGAVGGALAPPTIAGPWTG